jgi:hypothetical protein
MRVTMRGFLLLLLYLRKKRAAQALKNNALSIAYDLRLGEMLPNSRSIEHRQTSV